MPDYRHAAGRYLLKEQKLFQRIMRMRPSNLLAYYPLWEAVGTTGAGSVRDSSWYGNHATPTNTVFGGNGIGDDRSSALMDGATSNVNAAVAPLTAAFNGNEGSLFLWVKITDPAQWGVASFPMLITIFADASNFFQIQKNGLTGNLIFTRRASATSVSRNYPHLSPAGWLSIGASWSVSGAFFMQYINGVETSALGALTNFVGPLTNVLIGANGIGSLVWPGSMAHVAIWSAPLSSVAFWNLSKFTR